MPSRVSLLTRQYPGTLGITHMGVPVPPEAVTLLRLLKNHGYHSANTRARLILVVHGTPKLLSRHQLMAGAPVIAIDDNPEQHHHHVAER